MYLPLAIKYGLILGLASSALLLGAWLLDIDLFSPNAPTNQRFLIIITRWALIYLVYRYVLTTYRDFHQKGTLTSGRACIIGLHIGIFAGLVKGAYMYLFSAVIHPSFPREMEANLMAGWKSEGMNQDSLSMMAEITKFFVLPSSLAAMEVIGGAIGGIFYGFLVWILIQKVPTNKEPNA